MFLSHVLVPLAQSGNRGYFQGPVTGLLLESTPPVLWSEAVASAASLTHVATVVLNAVHPQR